MDRTSAPRLSRQMAEFIHSVAHDLFGSYRPEMHYMRGPGPKWREKRRAEPAAEARAGRARTPAGLAEPAISRA